MASFSGLLGGLLKGELSSAMLALIDSFVFKASENLDKVGVIFRDLSKRGAGGGGGSFPSCFSSPDRLGGGGDGGLDEPGRGDRGVDGG